MTTSSPTSATSRWLAPGPYRRLRVVAWLSFLAEVIIIGTGGAVRLTGSGLGCTEWPLCTPDSLIPLPEQGIHGVIEFGNRTMTGLVGLLALAVVFMTLHALGGRRPVRRALAFAGAGIVAAVVVYFATAPFGLPAFGLASGALLIAVIIGAVDGVRNIERRRDLQTLAWIVLAGVMVQAVLGGIVVVTDLNAFMVGFHYTASLALACVAAAYLVRMAEEPGPRERAVPVWFTVLTHVTGLALIVTIFFGVLTTGSGPHSGDANIIRNGFDASFLAHVHAWPGYVLAGLLVILLVIAWARRLRPRRWLVALTAVVAVQVLVGVWQAREGLPELLVGTHMVLAALSASAYTVVVLRLKRPAAERTQ